MEISNPLSVDQAFMRTMLLPGLLDTARKNVAVREDRVHIFEMGRVFCPSGADLPDEKTRVGIFVTGDWDQNAWLRSGVQVDYYLVKGFVERLCGAFRSTFDYVPGEEPFLHPGKCAVAGDSRGQTVGWLGEVHPLVLQAYDLRGPAVAAELDIETLLGDSSADATFSDLLAYPGVEQDLAVVVAANVPASTVIAGLRAAGGELLEEVAVFDVYEGTQVASGKKSLALRLTFRATDRTLSEAEVNDLRRLMLERIAADLGAELRV